MPDSSRFQPLKLDLHLQEQVLEITWADTVTSRFPLDLLRKNCPCASCRTERETRAKTLLPILSSVPDGPVTVTSGSMVGNYAIQLEWSDGHNTGIFHFRFLRSLHEQA